MAGTYFGKVCDRHPEFIGERKVNNRGCVECNREYKRDWAKRLRNRDRTTLTVYTRLRNQRIQNRTPPWADQVAIRAIYKEAKSRGLTVDHIIPLKGELVSGLHVQNNLQLLPASVNSSKGNKFA